MSEVIAEDLVGASLKAFAKGAGEEGVKEICSSLMGSLIGGGDNSSAEADAKILDQLSQIMSSLTQVQDSLQRIEQAIAQVDLDVVAVGIQKEKSIITSRYDSYYDALNGLAAAAKAKDRISFSQWRDRLVEESIQVKDDIPSNLNVIHGFIVDQNYLGKLANDAIKIAVDMFDFYSKVKLPLLKIAMVEIKGIHLLQFAGAASKDTGVNFPDASSAVERALSHLEEQDQALPKAIGPKTYGLVSTILTAYPKPASACISAYETRGLTYGKRNGESVWYGGENAQMWHIEPANDGPIVTDGSKVNGFRLLHVDSKKYIAIQPKTSTAPFILPYYDLTAVDSSKDAAIWNFHLTSDWKFHIQSQAYPDTYLTGINYKDDSYQPLHYIYLARDYGSRAKDTQSFIGNTYQGSVNDFWPGNITEVHDGEYLLPGSYLEDNNHKNFRFTFQDNKLGVWDVGNKAWKWDSGVAIDTSSDPYLRFSGAGILTLYQNSKQIRTWGPVSPGGTNYILGVTFGGALVIETGDAMYPNWSSE